MTELRTRLFVSLLVLLAAAPEASPQTGSVHKTGKTGNSRSSPAGKSMAEPSPVLCFQPGVGWRRVPTGQPHGSATGDASGPAEEAKLLSAKQARSDECVETLRDKKGLRGSIETPAILNPDRAVTKPGAFTPLQVNSPLHPNGSAASEAYEDSDQVGGRAYHAYISPIKLRRLIRNAPDYRTRKKFQQLQNHSAPKLHHARADTKPGQLAGRPLQGGRATSRRRSGANGRPGANPRDYPAASNISRNGP